MSVLEKKWSKKDLLSSLKNVIGIWRLLKCGFTWNMFVDLLGISLNALHEFFFLVVQVWVFYPGERRAHLLTCQWQHTNKTVIIIVTCPPTRGLGPPLWSEILVIPAGQVCYFFKLIELQAFGGSYSLLLPFLWAFSMVTDKAWTFFSFSVKGHLQCQHSTSLVQDPGSRILCIFFLCISIFEKSSIL